MPKYIAGNRKSVHRMPYGKVRRQKSDFFCLLFSVFCLLSSSVVFLAGCTSQDSVGLYVDAVVLKETGRPNEAVQKLNMAVKANPHFSPAYSLLGDIYQQDTELQKSADAYKKATQLNRWSFKDFFNLGKVYQMMEKFAEAVEAYVTACQLRPDHFEAHLNTARSYFQLEQYDSALKYGQAAKLIDPNASVVQEALGDIYKAGQDYDQAITSYRRALELMPSIADANDLRDPNDRLDVMMSLALAYLRSKRFNPAQELLVQVVELQPLNDTAYQYLGYCHLRFREQARNPEQKLAQVEKAVENYRRAVEINNEDWMAHKGLGVAYMMKMLNTEDEELKAAALEHWKISLQLKPDQPNNQKLSKLVKVYSKSQAPSAE